MIPIATFKDKTKGFPKRESLNSYNKSDFIIALIPNSKLSQALSQ